MDRPHSDTDMVVNYANPVSRGLLFYWPLVVDTRTDGSSTFVGPKFRQIVSPVITGLGAGAPVNGSMSYNDGGEDAKLRVRQDPEWGMVNEIESDTRLIVASNTSVQAISPTTWTAAGWFYLISSTGTVHPLIQHSNSAFTVINLGIDYFMASNVLRAYCTRGASNYKITSSAAISPSIYSRWIFVAATCDSSTVTLYLNGAQTGTPTATGGAPDTVTAQWVIGRATATVGGGVSRCLNVAVWNRVLNAGEIKNLYFRPWQMVKPVRTQFIFP